MHPLYHPFIIQSLLSLTLSLPHFLLSSLLSLLTSEFTALSFFYSERDIHLWFASTLASSLLFYLFTWLLLAASSSLSSHYQSEGVK